MLEAVLAFLAGLLIGSFLNVCIYRLPRDLSVVRPRSYCPACEKPIAWYDNIPLVSYILLGGRCRRCGGRISLRYPVVELLTGILFALVVLPMGVSPATLKWCLFGALMTGLLFSDVEERILPDEFTLGGTAAGILLAAWVPMDRGYFHLLARESWGERWVSVGEAALGAAVGAGLLWGIGSLYAAIRHKEGLGLGDVKMLALMGSFLGLNGALQALVIGSVGGSVIGLLYIWLTHKDYSTYELPFGTFLAVTGVLVGLLQGPWAAWIGKGGG
jgi:leader peptidase (prepilin peptidase)/N-methyltransferase